MPEEKKKGLKKHRRASHGVRRKRNGARSEKLLAFARAVNRSARPDLTRTMLAERVYDSDGAYIKTTLR